MLLYGVNKILFLYWYADTLVRTCLLGQKLNLEKKGGINLKTEDQMNSLDT